MFSGGVGKLRAFARLAALGLALGAASGASAATLPPMFALPLRVEALPSVDAPRPASFQRSSPESAAVWDEPPEPATLMLLATGLTGLMVLGHHKFA